MARYRIELATVIELFTHVDSMADAQKFALDFITQHAVSGTRRYKLHAIYDTECEVPSDPSPSDARRAGSGGMSFPALIGIARKADVGKDTLAAHLHHVYG